MMKLPVLLFLIHLSDILSKPQTLGRVRYCSFLLFLCFWLASGILISPSFLLFPVFQYSLLRPFGSWHSSIPVSVLYYSEFFGQLDTSSIFSKRTVFMGIEFLVLSDFFPASFPASSHTSRFFSACSAKIGLIEIQQYI